MTLDNLEQAIFYLYALISPKRYEIRPRSMTLDNLELENNLFSSFRRQYLANRTHRCRALTFASASLSCYLGAPENRKHRNKENRTEQ